MAIQRPFPIRGGLGDLSVGFQKRTGRFERAKPKRGSLQMSIWMVEASLGLRGFDTEWFRLTEQPWSNHPLLLWSTCLDFLFYLNCTHSFIFTHINSAFAVTHKSLRPGRALLSPPIKFNTRSVRLCLFVLKIHFTCQPVLFVHVLFNTHSMLCYSLMCICEEKEPKPG